MDVTGSPLPDHPQCPLCDARQGLSRCGGCQHVLYCSRAHQTDHWQTHKWTCSAVRKTKSKLDAEIVNLNTMPGDIMFREKPFENSVGHFWGIYHTRDYMRARYAHVEALLKLRNRSAVTATLDHLLDMQRLNRSDNMGLRNLIPSIYLRLDRDQECYDFVKWWLTQGSTGQDFGDISLPYLSIKDADAFETLDILNFEYVSLSHTAMLCLFKLRLLLCLEDLKAVDEAAAQRLPAELLDEVRVSTLSRAATSNADLVRDVRNGKDLSPWKTKLRSQVNSLFASVERSNKHYWLAVLEPGDHLTARPSEYSRGQVTEMQVSLEQTYPAWVETPKALDWLEEKMDES